MTSSHVDKEQKQTIPSQADQATRQLRAGPPLLCYWGVSVSVVVCVFECVFVCLTVHMCICLGKGSGRTTGHCCESWEFVRVHRCPLCLLSPLPDGGFQFSREAGVKRHKEWYSAPVPLFSPCPPCFRDKIRTYADDISLFVVEKKNHTSLFCKEPGGGVDEAHRPETITR